MSRTNEDTLTPAANTPVTTTTSHAGTGSTAAVTGAIPPASMIRTNHNPRDGHSRYRRERDLYRETRSFRGIASVGRFEMMSPDALVTIHRGLRPHRG
ncbi:hypothetical protein GCM10023192_82080 [Amycolatopsis samaneae]